MPEVKVSDPSSPVKKDLSLSRSKRATSETEKMGEPDFDIRARLSFLMSTENLQIDDTLTSQMDPQLFVPLEVLRARLQEEHMQLLQKRYCEPREDNGEKSTDGSKSTESQNPDTVHQDTIKSEARIELSKLIEIIKKDCSESIALDRDEKRARPLLEAKRDTILIRCVPSEVVARTVEEMVRQALPSRAGGDAICKIEKGAHDVWYKCDIAYI